jgi:hypothetical protein
VNVNLLVECATLTTFSGEKQSLAIEKTVKIQILAICMYEPTKNRKIFSDKKSHELRRWGERYLMIFDVNCMCTIFRILQQLNLMSETLNYKLFWRCVTPHPSRTLSWQNRLSFLKTKIYETLQTCDMNLKCFTKSKNRLLVPRA